MELTKKQMELLDKITNDGIRGVYRQSRPVHLTIDQLNLFNKETADGTKRIQWHSPNWVAMDRKSFDRIMGLIQKMKTQRVVFYDEFSDVNPVIFDKIKPVETDKK
jgi:hypothetical protein